MSLPLILIVDDNPENLTVIGELLQPNHAVRVANSGRRALTLAQLKPLPDLILLDVMMPDMDGYDVLRTLRETPEVADIPVVFLTALDSADDEERGLVLGAMDYITKPIRPAILLARVRTQLDLKYARDELRQRHNSLQAEVSRQETEANFIQQVTMHALARLAEAREVDAGQRVLRAQAFVRILGQALQADALMADQVSDQALANWVQAAPLHDLGKMGLPDKVLLKPGPLDSQEWALVKTHARLGAQAIGRADVGAHAPQELLVCAEQMALHHHERWDGAGYPDGLAGADIPLAARVMALADAYDALTSVRVYRPAFSHDQAVDIIRNERGGQFDPAIVAAFERCHAAFAAASQGLSHPAATVLQRPLK